ncbi:Nucleosome-remodeling factor subunit BPTF, partial [Ophiophagus hannah]
MKREGKRREGRKEDYNESDGGSQGNPALALGHHRCPRHKSSVTPTQATPTQATPTHGHSPTLQVGHPCSMTNGNQTTVQQSTLAIHIAEFQGKKQSLSHKNTQKQGNPPTGRTCSLLNPVYVCWPSITSQVRNRLLVQIKPLLFGLKGILLQQNPGKPSFMRFQNYRPLSGLESCHADSSQTPRCSTNYLARTDNCRTVLAPSLPLMQSPCPSLLQTPGLVQVPPQPPRVCWPLAGHNNIQ